MMDGRKRPFGGREDQNRFNRRKGGGGVGARRECEQGKKEAEATVKRKEGREKSVAVLGSSNRQKRRVVWRECRGWRLKNGCVCSETNSSGRYLRERERMCAFCNLCNFDFGWTWDLQMETKWSGLRTPPLVLSYRLFPRPGAQIQSLIATG